MKVLEKGNALLIDLDGTLFRGTTVIEGALAFMDAVVAAGIPYLYFTNNSTRSAEQVAAFVNSLGFPGDASQVYTSSQALADVLSQAGVEEQRAYVIGEVGLVREVARVMRVVEGSDAESADVVVSGLDRFVDYGKFRIAVRALLHGAEFYGTNRDRILPEDDGFAPGSGAILALLEAASGRTATVVGKPSGQFAEAACRRLGVLPSATWVIGDNVETDIAAGQAAGARTVLVETGVATAHNSRITPTMRVSSLTELL